MYKCSHCAYVCRSIPYSCLDCGQPFSTLENHAATFGRLQLAISLSGLGESEFEKEALQYLQQNMGLADIAETMAVRYNGHYLRFTTILKNLNFRGQA